MTLQPIHNIAVQLQFLYRKLGLTPSLSCTYTYSFKEVKIPFRKTTYRSNPLQADAFTPGHKCDIRSSFTSLGFTVSSLPRVTLEFPPYILKYQGCFSLDTSGVKVAVLLLIILYEYVISSEIIHMRSILYFRRSVVVSSGLYK